MAPKRIVITILIIALLMIQGCTGGPAGVQVVTEKVRAGSQGGSDYITGKSEALDSVNIIPKVTGKVSEVPVDVGSPVKAGQVLIKIDMAELEGVLKQSGAAVQDAEAGIEKAQIDLNTARDNYQSALSLYQSGALSKSAFENSYSVPYDLARLQAEKTAPTKLAQARAALQTAEANYANSVIKSPITGEVTARYINPGELCSTSKTALVISDLTRVMVRAYVDENKVNSFKPGQKVSVKVDSVERILEAEVKNISYAVDPVTKGYMVKFQLTSPDPLVRPGMFARVYTDGRELKQFVIPRAALFEDKGQYYVFIYNSGKVNRVPVKVEKISETFVVVGQGLSDGQDLVVHTTSKLEEGMDVKLR